MRDPEWLLGLVLAGVFPACTLDTTTDECAEGVFPRVPLGASKVVHVSDEQAPDGAPEGDGSRCRPYREIQTAIDRAESGSAILLEQGIYFENLTITKPITIVGSTERTSAEDSGAFLQPREPIAVHVVDTQGVFIRGLRIRLAEEIGIHVERSDARIEDCLIEGIALPASDPDAPDPHGEKFGYGLVAEDANVRLIRGDVRQFSRVGVLFYRSTGEVVMSTIHDNWEGGVHVEACPGDVIVEDSAVSSNVGYGVAVLNSRAVVARNELGGNGLHAGTSGGLGGYGVVVAGIQRDGEPHSAAHAILDSNRIVDNATVGVLYSGQADGIVVDNKIVQNALRASKGGGVWMQRGAGGPAGLRLWRNQVLKNRFSGIAARGASRLLVQENLIGQTELGSTFEALQLIDLGDGISISEDSEATIENNDILDSSKNGVVLDHVSKTSTVRRNRITANDIYGIVVQNQADAPDLSANTFSDNGAGDYGQWPEGQRFFPVQSFDIDIK